MTRRQATALALTLIAFMLLLSALAWPRLPAEACIPVHWRAGLHPDRFVGRTAGLLLLPLVALTVFWLTFLAGRVRSEIAELVSFSDACSWAAVTVTALLAAAHAYVLLTALGQESSGPLVLSTGMLAALGVGLARTAEPAPARAAAARRSPRLVLELLRGWLRGPRLLGLLFAGLASSLLLGGFAGALRLTPAALYAVLAGAALVAAAYTAARWRRRR